MENKETRTEEEVKQEPNPEALKPEEAKPGAPKPEEAKAEELKTEELEPGESKPEELKPERLEPEELRSEEPKPGEAKPEESKAEEAKKEESKPEVPKQEASVQKPRKKKRFIGWVLGIFSIILLLLAGAYGGVGYYYQTHFLPYTWINDLDCSQLDVHEVAYLLEQQLQSYQLEVRGRGPKEPDQSQIIGTITASELQLTLDGTLSAVQHLLEQQNPYWWIPNVLGREQISHSLEQGVVFDETNVETIVSEWDAFKRSQTLAPENAYIGEYSETLKGYELVADTPGSRMEEQTALTAIVAAIHAHATELDLEEYDCYGKARITAEDSRLQKGVNQANQWTGTSILYDWNGTEVLLDGDQIHQWITFEQDEPALDEEAVKEFVIENAKSYDTYGKKRKFTTTLGTELTLPSGAYGWRTDRDGEAEELLALIYSGAQIEKEPLYKNKGYHKGSDDIGNTYVEIDLTNQHLYLYEEGTVILETDFVSGSMNNQSRITPAGVFGLTYKTRDAVLRGADYETPVNYWMPFNGNVGMHDATWRRSFGGTIYLTSGSHGCVNLPLNKAAEIYNYISTGFPIICYYY